MIGLQSRFHTVFGGAAGYIALVFVFLLAVFYLKQNYELVPTRRFAELSDVAAPPATPARTPREVLSSIPLKPTDLLPVKPTDLLPKPREYADDILALKEKELAFPLEAVPRKSMKNTFRDPRGGGRLHEGVDILAPRNTPVVAIEDGKIARLWSSKYGGITIYQFDPSNSYIYYYAHLEKYAPNLKEGQLVRKGQVIGYVGTSGNAPPNTPHLHFAIYRAQQPGRWWQGKPIDPYPIYG